MILDGIDIYIYSITVYYINMYLIVFSHYESQPIGIAESSMANAVSNRGVEGSGCRMVPAGQGERRAWWGRAKKEAAQKVVNMYVFRGLVM